MGSLSTVAGAECHTMLWLAGCPCKSCFKCYVLCAGHLRSRHVPPAIHVSGRLHGACATRLNSLRVRMILDVSLDESTCTPDVPVCLLSQHCVHFTHCAAKHKPTQLPTHLPLLVRSLNPCPTLSLTHSLTHSHSKV